MLGEGLPSAEFSDKPIPNILCGTDTIASFFRPATHYTDLLTLRAIKVFIRANGELKNINLNRQKKVIREAVDAANNAERYFFAATHTFKDESALEYLEYSGLCCVDGYPMKRDESGCIPVLLDCGTYAVISRDDAVGFDFNAGESYRFEIIALGTLEEPTVVRPCIQ